MLEKVKPTDVKVEILMNFSVSLAALSISLHLLLVKLLSRYCHHIYT